MFVSEFQTTVRREQCRDLQREAEKERLIQQARTERQAIQIGAWAQSWIKHIAGWLRADHRHLWPISRSEKTAAL
jgi:hypothetical protein